MLRFILLAVVVAVASAAKGKCPWAMGKYPFNEQKFVGDWHLVAGVPIFGDKLSQCGKFNYQVTKDGYLLTYKGLDHEKKPVGMENVASAYFGKPEKASNLMGVWKKDGSSTYTSVYKQSIVATDYDNYAILIACKPVFDEKTHTFGRHIFAEILGRKPTLSKETMEVLKNIVSGYDIEPSMIQMADHTNCN